MIGGQLCDLQNRPSHIIQPLNQHEDPSNNAIPRTVVLIRTNYSVHKISVLQEYYSQDSAVNRTVLSSHHYASKEPYAKVNLTYKGKTFHKSCSCWYSSSPGHPYNSITSTFIEQYYADIQTPHH
ncbi:hypothetical protein C922_03320 [Plasmodium inui San Antonio 1]|uniref:Uncharacterized protein n=1 Tax=Plasmodium inui San Antonio 1 TaxID=1237626 RepID=W7ABC9_9APIC|nr:hypothetical protein C922_03320 [Plasmodium inui San Antonio 1]EUD66404.1 hypothetical protein C922_03320 [Plasmodium inui San Antonio 1]